MRQFPMSSSLHRASKYLTPALPQLSFTRNNSPTSNPCTLAPIFSDTSIWINLLAIADRVLSTSNFGSPHMFLTSHFAHLDRFASYTMHHGWWMAAFVPLLKLLCHPPHTDLICYCEVSIHTAVLLVSCTPYIYMLLLYMKSTSQWVFHLMNDDLSLWGHASVLQIMKFAQFWLAEQNVDFMVLTANGLIPWAIYVVQGSNIKSGHFGCIGLHQLKRWLKVNGTVLSPLRSVTRMFILRYQHNSAMPDKTGLYNLQ